MEVTIEMGLKNVKKKKTFAAKFMEIKQTYP